MQAVLSEATEVFRTLGAEVVEVTAPDVTQAVVDWTPACSVEAAAAHEATYPARKEEYGAVLASVLEAGRTLSGLDYQKIGSAGWTCAAGSRGCSKPSTCC